MMDTIQSSLKVYPLQAWRNAGIRLKFLSASFCCTFIYFLLVTAVYSESGTAANKKDSITTTIEASEFGTAKESACPFHVSIPEEALIDLRRRLVSTRWRDRETVNDQAQGAQIANLQELVRYWGTDHNWRKAEAKLNAPPQFTTKIDGLDIYFIHVRSRHKNALPLIITHGWPGSVFELVNIIGPLTDPTAFGGREEDAFDVVIPSLPGYGFSARPAEPGYRAAPACRFQRACALFLARSRFSSRLTVAQ